MAAMPELKSLTAHAIEAAYVRRRAEERAEKGRKGWGYRLKPSTLGRECERELWYDFRWCTPPADFSGQMLRLFETGHIQEARLLNDLRAIGCEVIEQDDEGKQIGVSFADGHGYGFLDGQALGLPEAPKTWHVIECKSHNAKSFARVQSKGVREAKPEHYGQTQIYMHLTSHTRGLYLYVNKDTDEVASERLEYDFAYCASLDRKAHRIVQSPVPLARISEDPEFFGCRFCDFKDVCHFGHLPPKSCRTCAFVTPVTGGDWLCERRGETRDRDQQEAGCDDHLFIPALVTGEQFDADISRGWIAYAMPDGRTFTNRMQSAGGDYYDC